MWEFFATGAGATILGILAVCTVLNVVAAVVLSKRSLPRTLSMRVEAIETKVLGQTQALDQFGSEMSTWKARLEGLLEEIESQFERLERKRASAAAAASRAESARSGPGQFPETGTRDERMRFIRQAARARGMT